MKKIFVLMFMAAITGGCGKEKDKDPVPQVRIGTVERIENFDSQYFDSRNVDVWLPQGYDPQKSYPVLYMHDGQMLFDSSITWNNQEWGVDEVMGELIRNNQMEPCLVVGIWNSGETRHADYFPQKPFESLPQNIQDSLINAVRQESDRPIFSTQIRSDAYLKFLVKELKPHIDNHYSTRKDRKHTFVAGSSMGGLISWYAMCEYPGVFGGAACLSTHWIGTFRSENNPIPGAFMDYLKKHLPDPATHKIYFDYGTKTLDATYEPYQKQVDTIMQSRGYGPENWKTMKFPGADHSEHAWRKRLDIPLTFLLGKNPSNPARQ